jgi:ribosomal protein S18 acetylase RimI-like enzyme
VSDSALTFREGTPADLRDAFEVYERSLLATAERMGVSPAGAGLKEGDVDRDWRVERPLIEFLAAQEGARFWLGEDGGDLVGYARVVPFGRIEHLTELSVLSEYQGRGIGRRLVEHVWRGPPTRDVGRLVGAPGSGPDLGLYMSFGTMPVTGQWNLEQSTARFLERRSQEIDRAEAAVHQLGAARAVDEWKRLEPLAIGHERPRLHEFFGRERTCLAVMGEDAQASALCWVSPAGEIGPGVASRAQDLLPVVLAALDRVAKTQEPERLAVFCTSDSWWLLRRLAKLGFRVTWPGWVMCSEPLPGLDRYLPTRPVLVL